MSEIISEEPTIHAFMTGDQRVSSKPLANRTLHVHHKLSVRSSWVEIGVRVIFRAGEYDG
jgi:hypothetical protein